MIFFNVDSAKIQLSHGPCLIQTISLSSELSRLEESAQTLKDFTIISVGGFFHASKNPFNYFLSWYWLHIAMCGQFMFIFCQPKVIHFSQILLHGFILTHVCCLDVFRATARNYDAVNFTLI